MRRVLAIAGAVVAFLGEPQIGRDLVEVVDYVGGEVRASGSKADLGYALWSRRVFPRERVYKPVYVDQKLGGVVVGDNSIKLQGCLD